MRIDDTDNVFRPRQVLDGRWQFRTDPHSEGVAQKWFTPDAEYPNVIAVPGNWQAQGFGKENRHLRHDYQGKAWYRRSIGVPRDWSGKRIWLHFGGVSNSGEVYVNGRRAGVAETFITPYEFDITDLVELGAQNTIACCVDSTGPAPVGMFNFIGRWGGLYRDVYVEARPEPAIDDVFVIPDVTSRTAQARVVIRRTTPGPPWEGRLSVRIIPVTAGESYIGSTPMQIAEAETESEPAVVDICIDDMRPWSPEDPFLYNVLVSLSAEGRPVDAVRDRFGMRQLDTTANGVLLLNGKPYFIRGIGDDTVEVITGTSSTDKQVHVERIKRAKQFGFNGCRFLSHTPSKEFFDAADETGFFVMASGEIYHRIKDVIPLLKGQVARVVKCHRNHPSWYAWSAGNEIFECRGPDPDQDWIDYVQYAHDTFKALDPTRLFVASDGVDLFPTDVITLYSRFGEPSKYGQPYDGCISEVSYFRRALSDTQITELAGRDKQYADLVRTMRPSAYWRLNERVPGVAADSSGNGNDGVYDPSMTSDDLGLPGVVDSSDGFRSMAVSAKRRGVNLQSVARSAFASGDDPFSVSMWVRPSGLGTGDHRTMFSCGTHSSHRGFLISEHGHLSSAKVTVGRYMESFLTSSGSVVAGEWNHVGFTYDGTTCRLFLNGELDSSQQLKLEVVQDDARIGRLITDDIGQSSTYQSRPHIWHEFNNQYVGPFPDISLKDRYTGVFRDHNCLSFHESQFAELGLLDRYQEVRQRSLSRFQLHLKTIFEAARKSKTLDGYGYWCMTDYPGNVEGDQVSLGIFNSLYEPDKFLSPEPMLPFNSATVLLSDVDEDTAVIAAGKPRRTALSISHYGQSPIVDGNLTWRVVSNGSAVQQGIVGPIDIPVGYVGEIATIEIGPLHTEEASKVALCVDLCSSEVHQHNQWDLWLFPEGKHMIASGKVIGLAGACELARRYDMVSDLAGADLLLADRLTEDTLNHILGGAKAILLSEGGLLARPRMYAFGYPWIRTTGTFIEDHPAVASIPNDGFCAYQMRRLFGGSAVAPDITEKGSVEREKLSPIVWALNSDADPAVNSAWDNPDNRWKFFRSALISEGRVGEGSILVCSLKLVAGVRSKLPEAGYLLDCLVDYTLSHDFTPATPPFDIGDVKQVFRIE